MDLNIIASGSGASLSVLSGVPAGISDPIAHIRAASPMPLRAEETIERAITEVALDDLVLVDDLVSQGLETPMPDWLGHMNFVWQKRSRVGNPIVSLLPDVTVRREDAKFDLKLDSLPVYCWSAEFTIHPKLWAEWELAQSRGLVDTMLDVSIIQDYIRRMNEAIDLAVIEGPPIAPNGVHIPGLIDTPNVVPYGGNLGWLDPSKTGVGIYGDLAAGIDAMQAQHHNGKLRLYVGKRYNRKLNQDYVETHANTLTIRQRILLDTDIEAIIMVPTLPQDTAILIEPKKTNLDIIVGQKPTVFSWMGEGPAPFAIRRFMGIACVMLRMREDYNGQNGVVKLVPSLS